MNSRILFSISLLFVSLSLFCQTHSNSDSLKPGVLVHSYIVKDRTVKSARLTKPDSLYFLKYTEQAGLSDWKSNIFFIPKNRSAYTTMQGYIKIDETRSYVFRLQNVDGAILYIDGKEVIDNDGVHEFKEKDGEIYLTAGYHSFKIISLLLAYSKEFNEISLAWFNNETQAYEWVPSKYFFYAKSAGENVLKIPFLGASVPLDDKDDKVHPSYDLSSLHDDNFNPKVGGMDFLPNGKLVVCTWDSLGQVFLIENATGSKPKVKRIAAGLSEPLGLKVVNNKIYVLQKHELTELIDLDGDEIIDRYNSICNSWGALGNFHEFAFGLVYKDGFFYAALATSINPGGKSTFPQNKDRGKAVKIGFDGSIEYIASGLRTPNGIGIGVDNEIFITDNQGDWLPACKMVHLENNDFFGSYSVELNKVGTLLEKLPVVWFPQGEIGNSTSQPTYLNDGPYKGQMLVGDVTHGGLKRIFVEKIFGDYQGCAFNFSQGFYAGVNRLCWGPDGSLYVGGIGSSGNWGQTGKQSYGLQRIKYNSKSTFEMLAVRARNNGIEIEFTEPVTDKGGNDYKAYFLEQWKYVPTVQYGGPKTDLEELSIVSINFSADRKKVFLEVDGLKEGHVVAVTLGDEIKNKADSNLWVTQAWYTLNRIPNEKGVISEANKIKNSQRINKITFSSQPVKVVKDPYAKLDKEEEQKIISLGPALIAKSKCTACHATDKKVLGPSFKMVSERYTSDPETLKKLTEKVYNGGGGVWGDYVMGAQSHLKKEDITKMVRYILSLKE